MFVSSSRDHAAQRAISPSPLGHAKASTSALRRAPSRPRQAARALVIAALLSAVGCGSDATAPSRARLLLDRQSVALYEGESDTLVATSYDATGAVSLALVSWSSSDLQVARVDSTGALETFAPGSATITATAGTISSTARVTVRADSVRPQLSELTVSQPTVDLTSGDAALIVQMRVRDAESGIGNVEVKATQPGSPAAVPLTQYCSTTLVSGSRREGVWQCIFSLHHYTAPGDWRVQVFAHDQRRLLPNFDSTSIHFVVVNPRVDDAPPALEELTFTAERGTLPGLGEAQAMRIGARDDASGILTAEFFLSSASQAGVYGCGIERTRPHP